MKNILLITLIVISIACSNNQNAQLNNRENVEKSQEKLNYLFQATYAQDFSMGNPDLVVKFQNLLKNCQEKRFDNISNYFTDDILWSLPDGNRIEGKDSVVNFLTKFWSSSTITDYSSAVHFSIKTKDGDEWVLIWDSQIVNNVGVRYQEAVQFKDEKISFINTFTKPIKK